MRVVGPIPKVGPGRGARSECSGREDARGRAFWHGFSERGVDVAPGSPNWNGVVAPDFARPAIDRGATATYYGVDVGIRQPNVNTCCAPVQSILRLWEGHCTGRTLERRCDYWGNGYSGVRWS